jgi:hypothetical protein
MLSPLFSSHWYQLSPFEVEMELEVQRDVVKLHFWRTTQRRTEQIAGRQQCWLGKVSTSPPGSSRAKAASEESQVGQIGWVLFHHLTQPLARSWQKKSMLSATSAFPRGTLYIPSGTVWPHLEIWWALKEGKAGDCLTTLAQLDNLKVNLNGPPAYVCLSQLQISEKKWQFQVSRRSNQQHPQSASSLLNDTLSSYALWWPQHS